MFVRLEVIVCVYKAGMERYVIKVVTSFLLQLEMCTAKIMPLFQVVENRMQQCCWGNIVPGFRQYCSSLLHLIAG